MKSLIFLFFFTFLFSCQNLKSNNDSSNKKTNNSPLNVKKNGLKITIGN